MNTPRTHAATATLERTLTPIIDQVMAAFQLAGLAVGIVKDGAVVYARGFGVRNRDTGAPITPRSLFHLASISKPFVATGIMRLVEQGRIDLDAAPQTYLPFFTLADDRAAAMTIRHMLCHASGMRDEYDYRWYAPEEDDGALERYVRSLAGQDLLFAPGERQAYSNIAYEVLGAIIARVSGRTFEDYERQDVLAPLGMVDSTFLRRDVAPALATTPHFGAPLRVLPGAYPYHRAHAPSSTLHSSVVDMTTWALACLRRGERNGRRILQPASFDELWREQIRIDADPWEEAAGLGWFLGTYRDRRVVSHGGRDPGYFTNLVLVPEEDTAVVLLANSDTAPVYELTDVALDLLFGLAPEPPRPPITTPLAPVLAAEGVEAAVERYRHLQATQPDAFAFDSGPFVNASWGAIDVRHASVVLPLLEVGVVVHPESSELHGLLGAALMGTGDSRRGAEHLRRAVALDAKNQSAAWLLAQGRATG